MFLSQSSPRPELRAFGLRRRGGRVAIQASRLEKRRFDNQIGHWACNKSHTLLAYVIYPNLHNFNITAYISS